jgi:hypothetical protein
MMDQFLMPDKSWCFTYKSSWNTNKESGIMKWHVKGLNSEVMCVKMSNKYEAKGDHHRVENY